jgi:RimJ/RimL family protein N-acetyltransferase
MFARTERLLLRPSWPEDARALYDVVADEAIVRNLALAPWPYTPRDAADFAATEHPTHYPNFLLWKRTGDAAILVGSCGIGKRDGQAELGYWIARAHWGLGYASEAARAVLGIARTLGHRQLVSGHFTDNPASGRVLRKVGFRATGQTEMRHSRARGHAVPCSLFEHAFEDGEASDIGAMRKPFRMHNPQQAIAA